MSRPSIIRLLEVGLAFFGTLTLLSLAYFGLTSPDMPYSKSNIYTVDRPTDPTRSGDIRAGDQIVSFNGKPFFWCMYFIDSPIYSAPRGVPIPVKYARAGTGIQGVTEVVLKDPSAGLMFNRSLTYLIGLLFLITSLIILLGSTATWSHLMVGLAGLSSSIVISAGQDISDFQAPLSLFFWWGIPVWAVMLVVAHAAWPVPQLHRRRVWALIGLIGLVSALHFTFHLSGATWFGCFGVTALRAAAWLHPFDMGLPLPIILYLLGSAYHLTDNPFSRLQVRAIAWAAGLGLGTPLLLSIVPSALGLPWAAPIEITLLISGIIPITYLFVLYRGELLLVSRFLNRTVFTLLFLIFWGVLTLMVVNAISYWFPQPDPRLVAVFTALPPLLGATVVRERLGLLVDLALYGTHYDNESVVSQIGQALAGVLQEPGLAEVVTRQLPQSLSIRGAALWLATDSGELRLIGCSALGGESGESERLRPNELPLGEEIVQVLNAPYQTQPTGNSWRAIVRLYAAERLVGLLLLGEKLRESVYSDKDIRTLRTLAGLMTTTVTNIHYLAERQAGAERERRLMLTLVENEEQIRHEVAGELHDRGISALGLIRRMVQQGRDQAVILAGLERVTADLRLLSNNRLQPLGLDQGLRQALEAMVDQHRQLGLPVSLQVESEWSVDWLTPIVTHELFYIAQEAVLNAVKHAQAHEVCLRLSQIEGQVELSVQDDGRGFDVGPLLEGRETHGMGIMQARASRIGGKLVVNSHPGQGTEIRVRVERHREESRA